MPSLSEADAPAGELSVPRTIFLFLFIVFSAWGVKRGLLRCVGSGVGWHPDALLYRFSCNAARRGGKKAAGGGMDDDAAFANYFASD